MEKVVDAEASIARFWSLVTKTEECWLWTAAKNNHGYGKAASGKRGKWTLAHRRSWILTNGPIPDNLCVLHQCDTPACVRPSHLFLGTKMQNSRDMGNKGRQGRQKITIQQRVEIRAAKSNGQSIKQLAAQYGVCYATICNVVYSKNIQFEAVA